MKKRNGAKERSDFVEETQLALISQKAILSQRFEDANRCQRQTIEPCNLTATKTHAADTNISFFMNDIGVSSHCAEKIKKCLRSIDSALVKIDQDEYGLCEECGEEIPVPRLKIMPYARFCVDCQTNREFLKNQQTRLSCPQQHFM